jgi:ethanolamine ammonia-lyase small subunit
MTDSLPDSENIPVEAEEAAPLVTANPWAALRAYTPARIALGRAGSALPTDEVLRFGLAHARARDAVHGALDAAALAGELRALGLEVRIVSSAAPDRATYLLRPDLGRRLDERCLLEKSTAPIVLAIADGLSAVAVQRHAAPLARALIELAPQRWGSAPVVIALQGRVALGDEIGGRLGARLVAMLIGERPGLSAPDSLGVYLTFEPRVGRTDAERNCLSNIRPGGLAYAEAARRLDWLAAAALARGMTGVALKDESAHYP